MCFFFFFTLFLTSRNNNNYNCNNNNPYHLPLTRCPVAVNIVGAFSSNTRAFVVVLFFLLWFFILILPLFLFAS